MFSPHMGLVCSKFEHPWWPHAGLSSPPGHVGLYEGGQEHLDATRRSLEEVDSYLCLPFSCQGVVQRSLVIWHGITPTNSEHALWLKSGCERSLIHARSCGVTVSTWDSESQDPSSNLGKTFLFFCQLHSIFTGRFVCSFIHFAGMKYRSVH